MKISEVTCQQVCDYCGVSDADESELIILAYMDAAKSFIAGYTGLTAGQLDEHDDIVPAYLVLINEMHTNRDYTVDKSSLNPMVKQILGMHSENYL